MSKIIPKETEQFETIGTFSLSYCFLSQNYYDKKPSPLAHIKNSQKRSLIYDLGNSRFFTESKESSESNAKNGGPFLLFIKPIESTQPNFNEENLGIRNNKRLSSINYMSPPVRRFIEKIKKILVENISHYNIYGEYGKYQKIFDYKPEGVTSWEPYKDSLIKLLMEEKLDYNAHIQVYQQTNPPETKPDPKPKEPSVMFNVTYTLYWSEIKFCFQCAHIDKIYIKLNGKESAINPVNTKIIGNLSPDHKYNFELYGKSGTIKTPIKIFNNLTPNVKILPEPPVFTINDSTHNITIGFDEPETHGIPLEKILVKYSNEKIPEEYSWNQKLILKRQIHCPTQIKIAYSNEVGTSKYKSANIKIKPCERKHFTNEVKTFSLEKYNHKCAVTQIQLHDCFSRYDFDHKDGLCCNNSVENCQPLLVEIHDIKSFNPKYFEKLVTDKNELVKWKNQKIKLIQDSLQL
jgi:hypothetical protein